MPRAKRILVVDDENGVRCLLSEVLSSEGFKVSLARDGQESLDKMRRNRFDLVITDIEMPRLDGISMLKRMSKAGRKERVIIMTGRTLERQDLDEGLPPIATRLQKPFRMDRFLDAVASALEKPQTLCRTRGAKTA